MIIMGVDVSLARTGIAVLEDGEFIGHAVTETSAKWQRHERLGEIYGWTQVYLQRWSPDVIAIETSAGWQAKYSYIKKGKVRTDSRASIEALAQARGVVLAAAYSECKRARARIVELDAKDARSLVCKDVHASKVQVAGVLRLRGFAIPTRQVKTRQGTTETIDDLDVSDALCLAVAVWSIERLLAMAATYKEV